MLATQSSFKWWWHHWWRLGPTERLPNLLARWVRMVRNLALDYWFAGRPLGGTFPSVTAGVNGMECTDYGALESLRPFFTPGKDETWVDGGCGQGRVLYWWLKRFTGVHFVGVELSQRGMDRLSADAAAEPRLSVRFGDLLQCLPPETTLLYLFNPCTSDVLDELLDRCERTLRYPERFRIIYFNARHKDRIVARPHWVVETLAVPGKLPAIRARLRAPNPCR